MTQLGGKSPAIPTPVLALGSVALDIGLIEVGRVASKRSVPH